MLNKEEIFEALSDWNYWNRPLPETIPRPRYEKEIARKAATGEVVVLKGVRRSGKSTLLINEMKRLLAVGHEVRDILYVNFEDPRFINDLDLELMERIKETYLEYISPSNQPFLFLDEVQTIPGWEKWVLKEYGTGGSHLYVTGSSSSLLSREIGTALSGRYLDIEIFPLDFREFLLFNGIEIQSRAERVKRKSELNRSFRQYMTQGGFPKLLEFSDQQSCRDLLTSYYDSILLRDIVARHDLSNYRSLEEISSFLLANTGSINSTNKLKNSFDLSFEKARDYTSFLEESYLIFQLYRFSWSVKKQRANVRKFYAIDTGLANQVSFAIGSRQGQNLETIVFLECKRRGMEVYYYKTGNDREVDFLVKKGSKIVELIQVSYTIESEQTRKRECTALQAASRELDEQGIINCTLLTMDRGEDIEWNGVKIEVRNVIDWLLFSAS